MDRTEELLASVPESVFATTWGREAVAELKRLTLEVKALQNALTQSEIPRFHLLHSGKNPHGFTAGACRTGDTGIYEEVRIGIFKGDEHICLADVLVGLADGETGEPRVLVSADGNSDEHTFAIFPMRPAHEAVEPWDQ